MKPAGRVQPGHRMRGAVLVVVLAFLAAGALLSAAVGRSAALELAMTEQGLSRLRAELAAEAGVAASLQARGWSAAGRWEGSGTLPHGGDWRATVELVAARIVPGGGPVEWVFEIRSAGTAGPAQATISRGFAVSGALPGTPQPTWWRRTGAEP